MCGICGQVFALVLSLNWAYVQPWRAEITIIVIKFNEEYNDIWIEITNMKCD